jgi:hypothetical protein
MKTKEEVKKEFLLDLHILLSKYSAELETEDHWKGYAECGRNLRMTVYISSQYDKEGNLLVEGTEIDLGKYFK